MLDEHEHVFRKYLGLPIQPDGNICWRAIPWVIFLLWWTRSLPIILPHELMGWLSKQELIPECAVDPVRVAEYWTHLKSTESPLKDMSPGHHVPLWLWGDGAKYLVSGQCLTVIVFGFVLDDDPDVKNSVDRCWPLCILQEEPWHWSVCMNCVFLFAHQLMLALKGQEKTTPYSYMIMVPLHIYFPMFFHIFPLSHRQMALRLCLSQLHWAS